MRKITIRLQTVSYTLLYLTSSLFLSDKILEKPAPLALGADGPTGARQTLSSLGQGHGKAACGREERSHLMTQKQTASRELTVCSYRRSDRERGLYASAAVMIAIL